MNIGDRLRQPHGRRWIAHQHTFIDQRTYQLLDEERIAAGTRADTFAQLVERRIATQEVAQQLGDRLRTQRKQVHVPTQLLLPV
ncbi:MAG TPA: hypothetical protein VET66_00265, partial [Steroidobacteraceae bacterium]|nr:hypothetical protein [Steroidobacteraceae bacterium]